MKEKIKEECIKELKEKHKNDKIQWNWDDVDEQVDIIIEKTVKTVFEELEYALDNDRPAYDILMPRLAFRSVINKLKKKYGIK